MTKRSSNPSKEPGKFHITRRLDLFYAIERDQTVDRTGIHVASRLLLYHCNSKTGQCNPSRGVVAQGIGRSERSVSDGIASLKVGWLRQIRQPGRKARYEWNWEQVSAEEWHSVNEKYVVPIGREPRGSHSTGSTWFSSKEKPSLPIHMNLESEPGNRTGNLSLTASKGERDAQGRFSSSREIDPDSRDDALSHGQPTQSLADTPTDGQPTHTPLVDLSPADPPIPTPETEPTGTGTQPPLDGELLGMGTETAAQRDRFWSAYPKRIERERTLVAFRKAVANGADPEIIISAAQCYNDHLLRTNDNNPSLAHRYAVKPWEWLEAKRWTDEYPDHALPNHPHAAAAQAGFQHYLNLQKRKDLN
jgi:hypothetical protein